MAPDNSEAYNKMYSEVTNYVNGKSFSEAAYSEDTAPDIYKVPVIGFVVIKFTDEGIENVSSCPLVSPEYFDDPDCSVELEEGEKAITVIPATHPMYKVVGLVPDIKSPEELFEEEYDYDYATLGYEHDGLLHPDWVQELRKEWVKIAMKNYGKSEKKKSLSE